MKPEITIFDPTGKHNSSPQATSRLVKSGGYKRQRVIVVLPALDMMSTKVALSHWCLIPPPNNGLCRILATGMEVGEAYSATFQNILDHPDLRDWEYILTMEHDNAPPADGLLRLLDRMEENPDLDAIGGLYWTKGEGGVPQIWGDPGDPVLNFRPQPPDLAGGLKECVGTGMGFTLYRVKLFKDPQLRRPWFKTEKYQGVSTQDLYFWSDARKYGHRCAIDCGVKVGHYDVATDTMW